MKQFYMVMATAALSEFAKRRMMPSWPDTFCSSGPWLRAYEDVEGIPRDRLPRNHSLTGLTNARAGHASPPAAPPLRLAIERPGAFDRASGAGPSWEAVRLHREPSWRP
jgi:hypothetical protein